MQKFVPIPVVIFLCLLALSCKPQSQQAIPDNSIPQPSPKIEVPVEHDPYFNGTDHQRTTFGPNSITRNVLPDKDGNIWFATWEGIMRYDGHMFSNLTNVEGLRRYRSFCLLEDRQGTVWIGTIGAGLYRYDGTYFEYFRE